jgi:hypothetical protein
MPLISYRANRAYSAFFRSTNASKSILSISLRFPRMMDGTLFSRISVSTKVYVQLKYCAASMILRSLGVIGEAGTGLFIGGE